MKAMPRLERIVWRDAHNNYTGWTQASEIVAEPALITSVGFVAKESKYGICLASDYDPNAEDFNGIGFIPKGCVVSRTRIK